MTTTTYTWTPTEGATETERDQEVDLGDGWHAIVGPDGSTWTWELWSTWLHDDDANLVASGAKPNEFRAKVAALRAFDTLR